MSVSDVRAEGRAIFGHCPECQQEGERLGVALIQRRSKPAWQRGKNDNTNGVLDHYFPRGTTLSVHTQQPPRP